MIGHIAENIFMSIFFPVLFQNWREVSDLYDLAQDAVDMGGVVSAEHGIGKDEKELFGKYVQRRRDRRNDIYKNRANSPNLDPFAEEISSAG